MYWCTNIMKSDTLPQYANSVLTTGTFAIFTLTTATIATITIESNIDRTGMP